MKLRSGVKKRIRQRSAMARLEAQLKKEVKISNLDERVPLSEKDIKRINKEIGVLRLAVMR